MSSGRQALGVDSQTLWDQLDGLAQHLVPAYGKLREYVLGADVLGADEMWWRLMDDGWQEQVDQALVGMVADER